MATVNAVILKHQKKLDGTWNVKISINHKSQARYIDTSAYVTKSSLDTKGKLKQTYIDKNFAAKLTEYRNIIAAHGARIDYMTSADIKEMLLLTNSKAKVIDLLDELRISSEALLFSGKKSKGDNYNALARHLSAFVNSSKLNIINITSLFLEEFEKYLITKVSLNSAITYLGCLKTAIGELRRKHNNPSINYFPIESNPFDYYSIPNRPVTKRRNLSLENVIKILEYKPNGKLETIAKDMFILSFCLCGMNGKDMYTYLNRELNVGDTLEYKRSKVMGKRKDEALTNVLILEEFVDLFNKYAGNIQRKYVDSTAFKHMLHRGWQKISESIGFKCTMYYARHSFANIARSVCKFSKDDVSFALNHKYGMDITDVYIDPDFSVVHKVQRAVVDVVFNKV